MLSFFWKEIRANFRWAVLGMVVLVWMLFSVYGVFLDPEAYEFREIAPLMSPTVLGVTAFGFPLMALALGFLQTVFENAPHAKAFLFHRPLTPNKIFFTKSLSGLLLYLLACSFAFLAVAVWGYHHEVRWQPFVWKMLIPVSADLLFGIVFYFAGFFIGICESRWFGPRILPLLAALTLPVLGNMAEHWMVAFFWGFFSSGLFVWLCWNHFISGGTMEKSGWPKKLLGVVYTFGFFTIFFLLVLFIAPIAESNLFTEIGNSTSRGYGLNAEAHLISFETKPGGGYSVTDLGDPSSSQHPEGYYFSEKLEHLPTFYLFPIFNGPRSYRDSNALFFQLKPKRDQMLKGTRRVFYSADDAEILVFDRKSNRISHRVPAPGNLQDCRSCEGLLVTQTAAYEPEPDYLTFTKLFQAKSGQEIMGASFYKLRHVRDEKKDRSVLAIATQSELHLLLGSQAGEKALDNGYQPLLTIPISKAWDQGSLSLRLHPKEDRFFIGYSGPGFLSMPINTRPEKVMEVDLDGSILASFEIPVHPSKDETHPLIHALGPVFPLGFFLIYNAFESGEIAAQNKSEIQSWGLNLWNVFGFALLMSFILLWWIYGNRRLTPSEKAFWFCLPFFFGLSGLLAYFVSYIPVKLSACRNCGKQAPFNGSSCEHCGKPFQPPVPQALRIVETTTNQRLPGMG